MKLEDKEGNGESESTQSREDGHTDTRTVSLRDNE